MGYRGKAGEYMDMLITFFRRCLHSKAKMAIVGPQTSSTR